MLAELVNLRKENFEINYLFRFPLITPSLQSEGGGGGYSLILWGVNVKTLVSWFNKVDLVRSTWILKDVHQKVPMYIKIENTKHYIT